MSSRGWRFGWDRHSEVDLFADRSDPGAETLSQAIRAAASEEPDADGSVLFGHLQGTVVGLRYYTGLVNRGEMVGLVRQPQNQYDRNAVMVANIYAAMAHVMDNNLAKVEGVVHSGTKNSFNMPLMLSFWGQEENKKAVMESMARRGYKLNTGGGKATGTSRTRPSRLTRLRADVSLSLIIDSVFQLKNAFDNLFEDLMQSEDGEKQAAESVGTPLLPHQKQALSWMCARENKSALPPFWERKGELYYNRLTCFSAKEIPERIRGGILADDMGLGKTLTTIALILTNFHKGKPLPVEKCVREAVLSSISLHTIFWRQKGESCCIGDECEPFFFFEDAGVDFSIAESADDLSARTTLIICPLSVISNWLDQFEQHVRADVKLNVYLYYGAERNRSKTFLSSQDVVITTYNVLSADFGNKSPLHGIKWLRVVLDEGHVVRNPNAQMSKAVLDLKAQRRWVLSGTPIQNSVKDLWMLLAFLRLKPFDTREWWNRVIQRPVTQGDRAGLQNLQTLVKCITLRRTKGSEVNGRPLVSLPEKTVCVEQVELSQSEREEYELARNEGRNTIARYVTEGTVLRNYADVLAILMRLRQHCCHPDLLAKASSDLGKTSTPAEMRERLIEKLRLVLASGSDEECSVCLDSVHLPVITHCAHVYCRPCIAQVISSEQVTPARCPLCRSEIKASELVEFPQEEMEEEKSTNADKWRTSSKVQALMGNLLRLRCEDGSIKSLIVSQFTRFLTILETPLRKHGFSFVRLDGTMSQKKRTRVIQEFQSAAADSPAIMLLSLKAGGVGLNLTAASHVFFMDPAWNPATEEQCIDRCHRLGQTRNVFVTKFIVKSSVEENMVKIQRQKQDLVEKAFGSKNPDRKTSRMEEIKALMEM
uniref:Helicase-like transcription factor n=1 Tax=Gasterosteus aculeatus aculeatus TaxID=481459 RepID=G3P9F7_GASAC